MDYVKDDVNVVAVDATNTADKRAKKNYLKNEKIRSRIWELDFLRGICVILMIFDHLMYDLSMDMFAGIWFDVTANPVYESIGMFADAYWVSGLRGVVRPIVVMTFFVLCGISCSFSRNNFKRGTILLAFSMGITLVTTLIGMPIRFGVLHMLSVSILVVAVIRLFTRDNKRAYGITCFALGALLLIVEGIIEATVEPHGNTILYIFSETYYPGGAFSADYFPILPNTGYVLVGAALAPLLYPKKRTLISCLDTQFRWYRPINFFGRHAAVFYLVHQVAWALILGLYTIIAIPNGWNVIVEYFFS